MALLTLLVTAGVVSVLVAGHVTVQQQQAAAEDTRVEFAFREFDRVVDSVALGEGRVDQVDFDVDRSDATIQRRDDGRLRVVSGGTEIANVSLGAVEYRRGDDVYAYQAGGVWRGTGANATMVTPPQFSYREGTLNVQVPIVTGDGQLTDGPVTATKRGTRSSVNQVGYVEGRLVTVEIQSEYYAGWAEYLRERTNDVAVSVDHANQTVVLSLGRPLAKGSFDHGVYATGGAGGNVTVDADGGAGGIDGPVVAEGDVQTKSSTSIDGTVASNVDASLTEIDPVVERLVADAERNASVPRPDPFTETLDGGQTYYVDADVVSTGEDVDVDLAGGNVTLLVDGNLSFDGGDIHVTNGSAGTAFRVYTTGNFGLHNGIVGVSGHPEYVQVYGTSDMQVGFTGGSTEFYGLIYAPREETALAPGQPNEGVVGTASECDGWDTCLAQGNSNVVGAIVGGSTYVGQSTGLVYDTALVDQEPSLELERSLFPPAITFLHVSVHDVALEDGDTAGRVVLDHAAHGVDARTSLLVGEVAVPRGCRATTFMFAPRHQ